MPVAAPASHLRPASRRSLGTGRSQRRLQQFVAARPGWSVTTECQHRCHCPHGHRDGGDVVIHAGQYRRQVAWHSRVTALSISRLRESPVTKFYSAHVLHWVHIRP
eukprot:jgi/Ulvmu1/6734/UM030_0069.1